jgi:6-phosphogluconolactonase
VDIQCSALALLLYVKQPRFVYVSNQTSDNVSIFRILPGGALQANGTISTGTGSGPRGLAVDPLGRYLYVSNVTNSTIHHYAIDPVTGSLTFRAAIASGNYPIRLTVEPGGAFLLAPNNGATTVSTYEMHPSTGALVDRGTSATACASDPQDVRVDLTRSYAYVACQASNTVSIRSFDPVTGTLGALSTIAGSGPIGVAIDPAGRLVYTAAYGGNTLTTYSINAANGSLSAATSPGAGTNPQAVVLHPQGSFAYVTNYTSSNISVYTLDPATSVPAFVQNVDTGGANPMMLAVDPLGQVAYTADFTGNTVTMFAIASGQLTALGTISAGTGPRAAVVVSF